jgi:hypothetical protein
MLPESKADPVLLALSPALDRLRGYAKSLVIKTGEAFEEAAGFLKSIKGSLATIEDWRIERTKPLNDTVRKLNADAKEASAPWLEMERILKGAMITYSDEQDRLRALEQRRANEAAEKERQRLQAIADKAAAKGQEGKAETFAERAASVVAPVAQQAAPKVASVTVPVVWVFEITDEALIPREYLSVDESKIRKVVTALKGGTNIAGVRAYAQKRIAAGVA